MGQGKDISCVAGLSIFREEERVQRFWNCHLAPMIPKSRARGTPKEMWSGHLHSMLGKQVLLGRKLSTGVFPPSLSSGPSHSLIPLQR